MKRNIFSNISSYIFNAKFIKTFLVGLLILGSFFAVQKTNAQNPTVLPSDQKLLQYLSGSTVIEDSFNNLIERYKNRTEFVIPMKNPPEIRKGAYTTNITNLRDRKLTSLSSQFDSSFTTIKNNSQTSGIREDAIDEIIAKFLLNSILKKEITSLNTLKDSTQNTDEKNIYEDVIDVMQSDLDTYTKSIDEKGIYTFGGEQFQLSADATRIINLSKESTGSDTETRTHYSYTQIIDKIKDTIDDSSIRTNSDIISLNTKLDESININTQSIKRLTTATGESNTDSLILIARREALTPVKEYVDNYINDAQNRTENNVAVLNAFNAAKKEIDSALQAVTSNIEDAGVQYDPTSNSFTKNEGAICSGQDFGDVFFSRNSNCSMVAFLLNSLLDGIANMIGFLTGLIGNLFDWIMVNGIYQFSEMVNNSKAYDIWKTIILALVTSLLLPLVFYMIIRMLIDNDTSQIEKVFPRILLAALFVYFSFSIVGWIIDQTNIFTIYIYRSMSEGGGAEAFSNSFRSILNLDTFSQLAGQDTTLGPGDWGYTPIALGKSLIGLAAVFVFFQGAILLFLRSIIMILSMVFSPLMLIPSGINMQIDRYRDMVISAFTNNAILAPIFMFLLLLAQKIGAASTEMIGTIPTTSENTSGITGTLLSTFVSTALVIGILQLAITVAKNMSGEIGGKISGKISAFTGGLAFGTAGKLMRNTVGRGAAIANERGWMKGKEGSTRNKVMTSLYGGLAKGSYDARKPIGAVGKGLESIGMKGINPNLGTPSNKSFDKSFKQRLYEQQKYHNSLSEEGKKTNIERLRGPLGGIDGGRIADELEKRGKGYRSGIKDKLDNDNEFKKKFDKANSEKDEEVREKKLTEVLNEHFKSNGKEDKFFEKELAKPENVALKREYGEALKETDLKKREEKIQKLVTKLDEKEDQKNQIEKNTEEKNPNQATNIVNNINVDSGVKSANSTNVEGNTLESKGSPAPSKVDISAQNNLKERLKQKYGTVERAKDGKVVKEFDAQALDYKLREQESKKEEAYHKKQIDRVEAKERQTWSDKGSRVTPTKADIGAQTSLKSRLQQKYGGTERMAGGNIVNEINPEILEGKIRELNQKQTQIKKDMSKKIKEEYQDEILRNIESKSRSNNISSTSSQPVETTFKPKERTSGDFKVKAKEKPAYINKEGPDFYQNAI